MDAMGKRKVVGQIVKDQDGKLYFESVASEAFDDDPVVVVRVEDYQAVLAAATNAGREAARKELGK